MHPAVKHSHIVLYVKGSKDPTIKREIPRLLPIMCSLFRGVPETRYLSRHDPVARRACVCDRYVLSPCMSACMCRDLKGESDLYPPHDPHFYFWCEVSMQRRRRQHYGT